jgi:hypothetical protein
MLGWFSEEAERASRRKHFVRSLARRTGAEEAFGQDSDGDIALKASVAGRGRRHPCRTAKLFEQASPCLQLWPILRQPVR